jgi:hypothetical protein
MALKPPFSRQAPVGPMYRIDMYSGNIASGTTGGLVGTMSSALFTMQWASTKRIMQLTTLEVDYMLGGTFTTAYMMAHGVFFVRGYSVVASGTTLATFGTGSYNTQALDTAGQTGVNLTINPAPVWSEFATNGSNVGAIYMAGTALLTAGTGTIDRFPMHSTMGTPLVLQAGATPQNNFPWMLGTDPNTTAPTFRYLEGFTVQPLYAQASGTYVLHVGVEWIEMPVAYTTAT